VYRKKSANEYSFGQGWVKLLSIRKRNERTYQTELPEFTTPTPPPDHLPSSAAVVRTNESETEADTTSTLPYQLTAECGEPQAPEFDSGACGSPHNCSHNGRFLNPIGTPC